MVCLRGQALPYPASGSFMCLQGVPTLQALTNGRRDSTACCGEALVTTRWLGFNRVWRGSGVGASPVQPVVGGAGPFARHLG